MPHKKKPRSARIALDVIGRNLRIDVTYTITQEPIMIINNERNSIWLDKENATEFVRIAQMKLGEM
jgi:hypothetical protein